MDFLLSIVSDSLSLEASLIFEDASTANFEYSLEVFSTSIDPETGLRVNVVLEGSSQDEPLYFTANIAGFYRVTATVESDEETFIKEALVYLESVESGLTQTIQELTNRNKPENIELPYPIFSDLKLKWLGICGFSYDESTLGFLEKFFIANLIIRDLLLKRAQEYLASQGSSSTVSSGGIKKMVSGPLETEWFNESESLKNTFVPGGLFDNVSSLCCSLASHLGIYLSFCPNITSPFSPILYKH
jgi:hypothetical protein